MKCSSDSSSSILLCAVCRAEGGLDHCVGVPREDGHREREQRRLGIAQRFDLAAQDIGQCLKRPRRL